MTKTVAELLLETNANIEHSNQIAKYSSQLFDLYNGLLFDFSEKEKEYLVVASKLHDIGYIVEKKSHHKHTMKIINDVGIVGFDKRETNIIANIARYHRSAFPNEEKHECYAILDDYDKVLVKKLSAILRIADGLDKPHKNLILRMRCRIDDDKVTTYLKTLGYKPNLEMAEKKKEYFELLYEKNLIFVIE